MRAQPFLKELLGKGSGKGLYNQDNKEAYYVSCVRAQGLDR
jgi:hypothetical protein